MVASPRTAVYNYHSLVNHKRPGFTNSNFSISIYMKQIKKIIKKMNDFFISIILVLVYFIIFGISFLFYKLFARKAIFPKNSFWLVPKEPFYGKDSFISPY
jgi:hypothetical protein